MSRSALSAALDSLRPLLTCPLCDPPAPLATPVTLPCGHSLCPAHVDPARPCPIPTCHPTASLPRNDHVTLRPPPVPRPVPVPPRPDVTLGKVLELVGRARTGGFDDDHEGAPDDRDDGRAFADDRDDRDDRDDDPAVPHPPKRPRLASPITTSPLVRFQNALFSELTCEICFQLLLTPSTTPCQHSFCLRCLHRALDHRLACPLCRAPLPAAPDAFFSGCNPNRVLSAVVHAAFPAAQDERAQADASEVRNARLDTPIFVCEQLAFPGLPTFLHFYQPRYRSMLRRCLESPTPYLGMIMPPRTAPISTHRAPPSSSHITTSTTPSSSSAPHPSAPSVPPPPTPGTEYGTMLEIRGVQTLNDGRCMVETFGVYRFRVLEKGMRDGYVVARVERIDDYDDDLEEWAFGVTDPPSPPPSTSTGKGKSRASDTDIDVRTGTSASVSAGRSAGSSSAMAPRPTLASFFPPEDDSPSPPTSSSPTSSSRSRPPTAHPPSAGLPDAYRPPSTFALLRTCQTFLTQLRQGTAPWVVQRLSHAYGPPPAVGDVFLDGGEEEKEEEEEEVVVGSEGDAAGEGVGGQGGRGQDHGPGPPGPSSSTTSSSSSIPASASSSSSSSSHPPLSAVRPHPQPRPRPSPASTSAFTFWVALVLPIDDHEKARLLPIKSPRMRLRLVVHWIEELNRHWWFSSGCVIL